MNDPKLYVNLYYNRHANNNAKYFCKQYESSDNAVNDGKNHPGFIMTIELEKKMIEYFETKDDQLLK